MFARGSPRPASTKEPAAAAARSRLPTGAPDALSCQSSGASSRTALALSLSTSPASACRGAGSSEARALVGAWFGNAATACSWSPFNSFWILQALGNAGFGELALAHAKLCWGGMLKLTRGCFLELFSPEWLDFTAPGAKLPVLFFILA